MNHRNHERHEVLKSGTILFEASRIDCSVHNLSVGGANLELDGHLAIPDAFELLMPDMAKLRCHVVWRKEARIGVAFS